MRSEGAKRAAPTIENAEIDKIAEAPVAVLAK